MYKLRPFLPLNVLKNVYYSLVYSHIVYAIEVWGSAEDWNGQDINPAEKSNATNDIYGFLSYYP